MQNNLFFMAKVSDNQDEDKLGRIKVTFTNENEVVSDWIPYLSSVTGDGTGVSCLPDIDDQVLVIALDMNQTKLVAVGAVWSEVAAPQRPEKTAMQT